MLIHWAIYPRMNISLSQDQSRKHYLTNSNNDKERYVFMEWKCTLGAEKMREKFTYARVRLT